MQQFALVITIDGVTATITVDAMTIESAENEFKELFSALHKNDIQFDPDQIERI